MVDQAQHRIQEAMTTLIDDLDKEYLRGIQRSMHLCAAECCDRKDSSVDQVHRCIESCSTPLTQAQGFVQNELSQFQERLQRCVMVCQDRVRNQVTADTSESQVTVYKAEFEGCAMKCVDDHISLMPSIKKRIAGVLAKNT
ncbi:protein FAM136A-like isoform X2 [Penaeus monodon]|uniref:protein FAM136A-like isoform X2 n=1 Tax=Penaeus monodon TaxID=6687 RepID=UPI0018A747F9|nr:protein FAM136A-like isoform X2 [Penaeus monodon]